MTYQRNMECPLGLAEEDVLNEVLERDVGDPDVRPHDHARDEHDERALDDVRLGGPLDLLQLAPGFGDEALRAGVLLTAGAGLRLRRRALRPYLGGPRLRARGLCARGLRLPAGTAPRSCPLGPGLPRLAGRGVPSATGGSIGGT